MGKQSSPWNIFCSDSCSEVAPGSSIGLPGAASEQCLGRLPNSARRRLVVGQLAPTSLEVCLDLHATRRRLVVVLRRPGIPRMPRARLTLDLITSRWATLTHYRHKIDAGLNVCLDLQAA